MALLSMVQNPKKETRIKHCIERIQLGFTYHSNKEAQALHVEEEKGLQLASPSVVLEV